MYDKCFNISGPYLITFNKVSEITISKAHCASSG